MQISSKWLLEQEACSTGILMFEESGITDPFEIMDMLIEGCDQMKDFPPARSYSWANWFIVRLLSFEDKIRYAIFAAREVLSYFENCSDDPAPRKAIEAAEAILTDMDSQDLRLEAITASVEVSESADKARGRSWMAQAAAVSAMLAARTAARSGASAIDAAARAERAGCFWMQTFEVAGFDVMKSILRNGCKLLSNAGSSGKKEK